MNEQATDNLGPGDIDAVHKLEAAFKDIKRQLALVIVGQDQVIEELLIALFSRGHCILEGVPGLAKTLMISTLSKCLSLAFSRIQFTPDLMPSDITGTEVIEENRSTGQREFKFIEGPLFANLILADEINRTPPKTQAALLEAMQERQVTVGRIRHKLSDPFFVLATQNPIEQEGTYPLPEAQQDRFMFKVFVKYPSFQEEFEIARRTTSLISEEITPVLSGENILALQRVVRRVPVTDHVIQYTLALVRQTRVSEPGVPKFIKDWLSWGAGPRAVQNLILGGKARACFTAGRTCRPKTFRRWPTPSCVIVSSPILPPPPKVSPPTSSSNGCCVKHPARKGTLPATSASRRFSRPETVRKKRGQTP